MEPLESHNKKILVTGGAGYIGSHIAKAIAVRGWQPIVFDNLSTGHRWQAKWGDLVVGDVRDDTALDRVFRDHDIAAVVHLAGVIAVGESTSDPGKYYDNNVVGTLRLLDAMKRADVSRIVFSSTCALYGTRGAEPIGETAPVRCLSPYAETKSMAEQMLRSFDHAHGFRSVALRYFNASGADSDGEAGEAHDPETHLIPLVIDAALGVRDDIAVFGTDYPTADGSAVRDYVHVADLADAHLRALDYLEQGGATTGLNLGTGVGHSVLEVIRAVEEVSGRKVKIRYADRRDGDAPMLVADPTLVKQVLGWEAKYNSLNDIVETAWNWHRKLAQPQTAQSA